jgi:FkbM family methyltransferase
LPRIYRLARSIEIGLGLDREPEMAILHKFVRRGELAIDVGANSGSYVHRFLNLGASVIAIEANPYYAKFLNKVYGRRDLEIVCAAASSISGRANLKIPKNTEMSRYGLATIEPTNDLGGASFDVFDVPRVTLDEMDLRTVGIIKIDVEGHELEVLKGAKSLIKRDRPTIFVEAENRHRADAVGSVSQFMAGLGYSGFMLDQGELIPLWHFDPARDQLISKNDLPLLNSGRYSQRYIHNFIFLSSPI